MANNKSSNTGNPYEQHENKLLTKSDEFLQMLTKRGILGDQKIDDTIIRTAKKKKKRNMFHNTEVMLKNYRDISWALECFPSNIAEELDAPLQDLDALIGLISAEIGMDNLKLENRLQSIKKSRLLLDRFNEALTVLRKKPRDGEKLYNVIFQTYLIPEKLTHQDLIYRLNMSTRHYYRLRKDAINILAIRLWTTPSNELDSWLEVLTLLENI